MLFYRENVSLSKFERFSNWTKTYLNKNVKACKKEVHF